MKNTNPMYLDKKIINVVKTSLANPESEIYKAISKIYSEFSGEKTESTDIASLIGKNRDSITSFVNEDITELDDYAFKDCVNLEYVYLPNCTKLGYDCFQNCTSLRTLLLPAVTEIDTEQSYFSTCTNLEVVNLYSFYNDNFDREIGRYFDCGVFADLESLKIVILGIEGLADGGECPISSDVEILVLPSLGHLGYSSGFNAENIIIPNTSVWNAGSAHLNGTLYVNDELIDEYNLNDGRHWNYKYEAGEILPLSELPEEIKSRLEICKIQI